MILPSTARAAALLAAGEENHPVLCWSNLFAGATWTTEGATANAAGPAANAATPTTWDEWIAVPTADHAILRAALAAPVTVSALGLAAHNLGTLGASVIPQVQGASRTNLVLRSQEFDTASWTKTNLTVTLNDAVAPDGTQTAERLVETVATGEHSVSQSVSVVSGTTYTASVFVRAGERSRCRLVLAGAGFPATSVIFNLSTGVITTAAGTPLSSAITSFGDWRRCEVRLAATATASGLFVLRLDNGAAESYAGSTANGLHVWGAQIEAGAAATGYVATTSAPVASDWHDLAPWHMPADDGPILHRIVATAAQGIRWRIGAVTGADTVTVGVAFAGPELRVPRKMFRDVAPILTPTEIELQANVSEGGELLGSAVVRRGSMLELELSLIPDTFFRGGDWLAFQRAWNEGAPAFLAWRPAGYPQDLHYGWRPQGGGVLRPVITGPLAFMGATLQARVHEA